MKINTFNNNIEDTLLPTLLFSICIFEWMMIFIFTLLRDEGNVLPPEIFDATLKISGSGCQKYEHLYKR